MIPATPALEWDSHNSVETLTSSCSKMFYSSSAHQRPSEKATYTDWVAIWELPFESPILNLTLVLTLPNGRGSWCWPRLYYHLPCLPFYTPHSFLPSQVYINGHLPFYPVYPFTLHIPSYLPKSILMAIYLSTLFTLLHSILPPTFNLFYHLPFYPVYPFTLHIHFVHI